MIFDILSDFYRRERKFIMELRLDVHINSLIAHLVELSSQLPGNLYTEIFQEVKSHGSTINFLSFQKALRETISSPSSVSTQ